MSFFGEQLKVALIGTLMVTIVSFGVYTFSQAYPAKTQAIYFIVWAFIAVPAVLVITGWMAAQAAYFAGLGPNQSIASTVVVALIAAMAGIGLWVLAAAAMGIPEHLRLFSASLERYEAAELITMLIMCAVYGAIGGIFHYFTLPGRAYDTKGQ